MFDFLFGPPTVASAPHRVSFFFFFFPSCRFFNGKNSATGSSSGGAFPAEFYPVQAVSSMVPHNAVTATTLLAVVISVSLLAVPGSNWSPMSSGGVVVPMRSSMRTLLSVETAMEEAAMFTQQQQQQQSSSVLSMTVCSRSLWSLMSWGSNVGAWSWMTVVVAVAAGCVLGQRLWNARNKCKTA